MYIAEISPAKVRGKFVSIQQLTIVIGILAAQLINWQIADPVPKVDQLRLLNSSDSQIQEVLGPKFQLTEELQRAKDLAEPTALAEVKRKFPSLSVVNV